ncbi:PAS domain S-box protein [Phycisphaerales bacterium AB-hyl4]|uniref:PAS domain S-box protein n=1 Tax=Natronomicrosphaera hydrolytica TaxID=3242702 RepID=A0ABV4U4G5_9BACT
MPRPDFGDNPAEAFRQSEQRLRLILDSALDFAIFTTDLDGQITSWNNGAERLLGYSEEEAIGLSADVIFTREDVKNRISDRERKSALTTGRGEDERWHARKDGSCFWSNGLMMPLKNDAGEAIGFLKILRDQTQAKQSQEQLETHARQQRAVAELGQQALQTIPLFKLIQEAAKLISRTLETPLVDVLRWKEEENVFQLVVGVGWPEQLIGHATVEGGKDTLAGYTLATRGPVIVENLPEENRFKDSTLLSEQGAVSGVSVIVAGEYSHTFGVLSAHATSRREFTRDDVNFLQAIANILGGAIQRQAVEDQLNDLNETLEQRVVRRTQQIRALAFQLTRAEEQERRRLAQVLHDHLQQLLVASRFQLASAQNLTDDPQLTQTLRRANDLLGQAVDASRSLTVELSPPVLHDEGLVAALRWLGQWMHQMHGLTVEVDTDGIAEPTEESVRIFIFQAVRELLLNAVKHADVKEAHVRMTQPNPDQLHTIVEDQGKGFDPDSLKEPSAGRAGYGLLSIRERLHLIGGRMHLDTKPDRGTKIILDVPLRPT